MTAAGGMIVTNILEGEPVLLFEVATPKAIDAKEVTLKAHVLYLICDELGQTEKAAVYKKQAAELHFTFQAPWKQK